MGRKPVGKKAMTDAQRQARRRKKLRKAQLKLGGTILQQEKQKKKLKAAKATDYIPVPPGITYWRQIKCACGGWYWQPKTQPLPAMNWEELSEEELSEVAAKAIYALKMRRKGKVVTGSGVMVWEGDDKPSESPATLSQGELFGPEGTNKVQ